MAKIAIDAMGGDNAPKAIIEGAVIALNKEYVRPGEVILVGQEDVIRGILKENDAEDIGLEVFHASQIVEMCDSPVETLKKKRDSSIIKALSLVKKGKADAMISAGNTGAVVAGSVFLLGMIEGVRRPGISVIFPAINGICALIDVGANIHCKPINLFQYGWMAANYMQYVLGVDNPRVGIVNIGEEDKKGTGLIKETHELFEKSPLNFIGNIEGQNILLDKCDVIVCDGFVGNVILKCSEGFGTFLQTTLYDYLKKEISDKDAMQLGQKILKDVISRLDYAEYGAAPLLGVNGLVFIGHGRSDSRAISSALRIARISVEQKVNKHIATGLAS